MNCDSVIYTGFTTSYFKPASRSLRVIVPSVLSMPFSNSGDDSNKLKMSVY